MCRRQKMSTDKKSKRRNACGFFLKHIHTHKQNRQNSFSYPYRSGTRSRKCGLITPLDLPYLLCVVCFAHQTERKKNRKRSTSVKLREVSCIFLFVCLAFNRFDLEGASTVQLLSLIIYSLFAVIILIVILTQRPDRRFRSSGGTDTYTDSAAEL